ncbi:uncharacterized protein LOC142574092 isoform X1 [Dermacentor variabilis]|uniref:uncharacterized protein LOC142574092 isoform X1 n=1 Tax=Dermacentor variabilis TaxID=34621 RepID=UPI003F5B9F4D
MKSVPCLLVVIALSAAPPTSGVNVCARPPVASLMLKVLKPTAKVLLDCVADVLIFHRVNSSFLSKVVAAACEYHVECYHGLRDIKDMHKRRDIAGECMLRNFLKLYPTFESVNGAEGIEVIKKLTVCLHNSEELQLEDSDVTNAVMHWIFEVLRTDA